jgi:hypothetical protein
MSSIVRRRRGLTSAISILLSEGVGCNTDILSGRRRSTPPRRSRLRQWLRSIPYPLESAKVVLGRGQRAVDRISEAQSGFTRNPSERSAFVRKLRDHDRRRCRTRTPRNLSSGQASRGPVGSAAPRSDGQSKTWPMTAGKTSMAGTSPAMMISRRVARKRRGRGGDFWPPCRSEVYCAPSPLGHTLGK